MQTPSIHSGPGTGKNDYVQGARGLFAFFVFAYHTHNSGLSTIEAQRVGLPRFLLDSLEHGVELFFGVSGLVIVASLLRRQSAGRFMFDRLTRLAAKLTGYKIDIKSETQAKDAPGFRYEDYVDDYEDETEDDFDGEQE